MLCVNQEIHSDYLSFDTELEMRAHWEQCHKIALSEEYNMFVVPDSSKEPPELIKLPMLVTPAGGGGLLVAPSGAGGRGKGRKGTSRNSGLPPVTESKEVVAMEEDKGEPAVAPEPPVSDVD